MPTPFARTRRFFVPEVIQTSAMDCGPAALGALLGGYGISVSYGRLREACQTEVDGTSIDTLEEVAKELGLEADQVLVPPEHFFSAEAKMLPALLVVRNPTGHTHFVVVWNRVGDRVQIMDPARGRIWTTVERLRQIAFVHEMPVPAATWREWASSDDTIAVLRSWAAELGIREVIDARIARALEDPGWRSLARVDAVLRAVGALVRSGAIAKGERASRMCTSLFDSKDDGDLPRSVWAATATDPDEDGTEQVKIAGFVLVSIRGRLAPEDRPETPASRSEELARALVEPRARPAQEILKHVLADGVLTPMMIAGAIALSAIAVMIEALLFRGMLDLGRRLVLGEQRLVAMGALLSFLAIVALLEMSIARGVLRIGRRIELRFRTALLEKIPRLRDRYFQSRPSSDMAERAHVIHGLRLLPPLAKRGLEAIAGLLATSAGIMWIDPLAGAVAFACAVLAIVLPSTYQKLLAERDLRVSNHAGALGRYHLDTFLGLVAIRTHGAEQPVSREHEGLLTEWARASAAMLAAVTSITGAQALFGFGVSAIVVATHLSSSPEIGSILLVAYWALSLPAYGEELAEVFSQYPIYRNLTLRQLELLGSLDEDPDASSTAAPPELPGTGGVGLSFEGVTVRAGGHAILEGIDLEIAPGSRVGIVGASGAGKSSLVGVLLGWHRPSEGRVRVDGRELDGAMLAALRGATAWVDPAVQLWNRSLLANLRYGARDDILGRLEAVVGGADLFSVLEHLPEGLDTRLGEGGGLVSGGEGQRVRLARALARSPVRLALLDEPFRGLDREKRRLLLEAALERWRGATILCVTHDVGHTAGLDRVLVVDGGAIVEDGDPRVLAADSTSRYRRMLDAERSATEELERTGAWRRLVMTAGRLEERGP